MGTSATIGKHVRQIRKARGLTQAQLAAAAGCSVDWLKSVETGRRQADRYSVIESLAAALHVTVNELTGLPRGHSGDPEQQAAHMAVPRLRDALLHAAGRPEPVGAPTPLESLRRRVENGHQHRRQARYGDALAAMPGLLEEIRNTAALLDGTAQDRAHSLLAEARHDAAMVTKKLGYLDLAALAALQAVEAAERAGDPLLVTAMVWTQAEVDLTAGAIDAAHDVAARAIERLESGLGADDPAHWSLWGTMHLVEAVIQARWMQKSEADAHLAEADAAASRVGSGRSDYETQFGPENCAIHTVHIAMELGEGSAVLERVRGVDLSALPKERRARHGIDRALARSRDGDDTAAMSELLEADRIAPECVRNHAIAQELVTTATERARTVKAPIAEAARRFGLR